MLEAFELTSQNDVTMKNEKNIIWFEDIDTGDTAEVGGKNSSLGEMIAHLGEAGVKIPGASPQPPMHTALI